MIESGLVEEVKSLAPFRHLNALQTVGYSEIFEYLDGKISLEKAITDIKTNTRQYAKRQLTWFRRDKEMNWVGAGGVMGLVG
jgi:tRNA dimethylallyltransferase